MTLKLVYECHALRGNGDPDNFGASLHGLGHALCHDYISRCNNTYLLPRYK